MWAFCNLYGSGDVKPLTVLNDLNGKNTVLLFGFDHGVQ